MVRRRVAISAFVALLCLVALVAVVPRVLAAGPTMSVSGYTFPGSTVTIGGGGFAIGDTLQILFDSTPIGTTPVHSYGGCGPTICVMPSVVQARISIPANATRARIRSASTIRPPASPPR